MKSRLTFRTIWRIDALIILIGGVGAFLMFGYTVFELAGSQFRSSQNQDVVNVQRHAEVRWRLGNFETIPGAGYMVAPVSAVQSDSTGLPDKVLSSGSRSDEASAIRNYLFVSLKDKSSRRLIPNNDRLILSMEWLAADGSTVPRMGGDKTPVKWLIFRVVPADTDGDGRLTESDRKAIAVANPDGSQYAEVLRDADAFLGQTWLAGDKLIVAYSAGARHLVAEIGLPDRKITATEELPKINP